MSRSNTLIIGEQMKIVQELKDFAKDLSILIVEDDISLNEEIVSLVELFFKDVFFAYNGVKALEIYKKNNIDIIVTDITMPKMNGVVLSKNIKRINPEQDIIVISAHRDADYLVQLINIGIKQLVYKPFEHHEFLYRLLRVCEDKILLRAANGLSEQKKVIHNEPLKNKSTFLKVTSDEAKKKTFEFTADMQPDIERLLELRDDFEEYIELISIDGILEDYLENIANISSKIYTVLSQINATSNMAVVVFELANFLENLDYKSLSDEQKQKLGMLEHIYDDISKFIDLVFITQEVKDTSYLEDSLSSSLTQLKQNIFEDFLLEEDLEFF